MNPWIALLIGLLLGWLIPFLIDWFFWNRKALGKQDVADLQAELDSKNKRIAELEEQKRALEFESEPVPVDFEPETAEAGFEEDVAEAELEEMEETPDRDLAEIGLAAAAVTAVAVGEDDEDDEDSLPLEEDSADESEADPSAGLTATAAAVLLSETMSESEDETIDESAEPDLETAALAADSTVVTGAAAKTRDLSYIEGIGPVYGGKLAEAGVHTPQELLQRGATPKGRQDLANVTGISGHLILKWINNVDLYRIKGLGSEYADLLKMAGVDTVPELAQRNPENLYNRLIETNQEKKLVRRVPSKAQVEDWVNQANQLPRVINY